MTTMPQSSSRPEPNPQFGVELVRDWASRGDPRATVVLVHGIAEHSGRYEGLGILLADAGLHIRSFDLRGAGASGGPRWDIEDWSLYLDQIERHVRWATSQNRPVVLMGHSLGATLALDYVLDGRVAPDLLVASAPAISAGAAWQRAVAPLLARIAPTAAVPNRVKGHQLSKDPKVGEEYFADPLVCPTSTPRLGINFFRAMDRVRDGVARLDLPTLVVHGGDDTLVPPQTTAFLAENQSVDRILYPGLRHELHNEPEGPQVISDIVEWIDRHI
jgi:alpha-beta hydrolase superfamily lysophospholipase